jgi:hypothetical protein
MLQIGVLLVSLILLPFSALADTFTIDTGLVWSQLDGTFSFNVAGENFTARGGDTGTTRVAGPAFAGQNFTSTTHLSLAGGTYSFNGVSYVPSQSMSNWTLQTSAFIPQGFNGGTLTGTADVTGLVALENQANPRHTILGSSPASLRFVDNAGTVELRRVDVSFEPASPIGNTIGTSNGGTVGTPVGNTGAITSPVNTGTLATVPEPGTWLLMATGFGTLALYRRRYA